MKKLLHLAVTALLLAAFVQPVRATSTAPAVHVSLDVLSDSRGVDLRPYLASLTSSLRDRWMQRVAGLPAEHRADHRETLLELTLAGDGQILALRQQGVSQDQAWSQVAWDATKGNSYPPLPGSLKDGKLTVRLHFISQ